MYEAEHEEPSPDGWPDELIVASSTGATAADATAVGAAVAVAAVEQLGLERVLLVDLEGHARARPSLLATDGARELEAGIRAADGSWRCAARGRICVAAPDPEREPAEPSEALLAAAPELALVVCGPGRFRELLDGCAHGAAALLAVSPGTPRALLTVLARELRERNTAFRAWLEPPGSLARRRALAGLDPGGRCARRAGRDLRALVGASMPGEGRG
jgi:hypothetical protein